MSGNANFGKVKIEDISMCLVPLEGRADFIKSDTATGMKITEYKKAGSTVWTKLDSCKLVGFADCKKITEKDWKLIERNRVGGGKFVLWYNDLGKAVLADAETKIQCNDVTLSVGGVERAEVETEMAKRIFRTLRYERDENGDVKSILAENVNVGTSSRECKKYYDAYNRLYKSVDAEGVAANYSYDERGRATQVCSSVDSKTVRTFRNYENPSADGEYIDTQTDEYGGQSRSCFKTSNGILTARTFANGLKTEYGYDGFLRPDKISASVGSLVNKNAFAYNGESLPAALSSANTEYEFEYDGQKKISHVGVDSRSRLTVTRSADGMGKTVALDYSNGGKIINSYDKFGNLVKITDAVSNKELMYCVYGDAYENVSSVTSPQRAKSRGSLLGKKGYTNISEPYTAEYSYNGIGNVDRIRRSDAYTESYAYDELGRISGEYLAFGNYGTLISKSYSYFGCDAEENGALKSTASVMNGMEISDSFTRDKFRRITSRDISAYLPSFGFDYFGYNFVYDDYVENGKTYTGGRVKKFTAYCARDNAEGTDERSFEENYSYDESGNITAVNDTKYSYDKLGRLTREDNAVREKTYAYSYDADGNITCKKEYAFTYGALSSPTKTYNYSYDGDKLAKWNGKDFIYDGLGNPTSYKGYALSWTRGTLLESFSLGDGRTVAFEYDGEGMRRSKTVKNGDTVESKTVYAYSNGKLIGEERTQNGKKTEIVYFYSNGELTGFMRDLSQYFYLKDGLGNITGVYDGAGNLCESYTYDAWGNCTVTQGGIQNAMRYKGYYFDEGLRSIGRI